MFYTLQTTSVQWQCTIFFRARVEPHKTYLWVSSQNKRRMGDINGQPLQESVNL